MASSQNEQDNRRYAVAAAVPMLEPADSQEAYDFTLLAIEISERWRIPVLLRMTTRVCHSYTVVRPCGDVAPLPEPHFERDVAHRVMIPAYARPAHRRLREKLAAIARWNEIEGPNRVVEGAGGRGIITSGISYMHVREAAPEVRLLKLGMSHPLPLATMREFARASNGTLVVEEGDPYLAEAALAAGIAVETQSAMFRFGELNVDRVRRIVRGDLTPEAAPPAGKPPELCPGCPHRTVFTALRDLGCIVAGDIGCYTLGVLPPFNALDTCVCMGAGITIGLGLRQVLPPETARRVVSVIGDSTFLHSGITGLVEAVYNPPATGHLTIILDNGTTAMTGMQEHAGTGRSLDHQRAGKVIFEDLVESLGMARPVVMDPTVDPAGFQNLVKDALDSGAIRVIIARRDCLLATSKIKTYEQALKQEACLAPIE
jgi:indolepyruvate ferredoxin oxidoreductase alpha subunit